MKLFGVLKINSSFYAPSRIQTWDLSGMNSLLEFENACVLDHWPTGLVWGHFVFD